MVTVVMRATRGVNPKTDDKRQHAKYVRKMSRKTKDVEATEKGALQLLERIEKVLSTGSFDSARDWCKAAGLSPSYIGVIRSRLTDGTQIDIGRNQAVKLANAAGISLVWLQTGEGDMISKPASTPPPERVIEYEKLVYTSLVPVLASLRANGELPGVLAGLEAERLAPDAEGHDEDYWWKRAAHYRAKLKGTSVQRATEDDETFGFVPGSGPKANK